ncbi:c-type cytochrome domain-containing protein [Flaviaesturariibacter amylovorans]|uniref:Cytochrome C Planctomycete-type domain-containing protein n=1 Tax=Flaviaesturariibacter amylovorans TaxID=1084520 RepID=A0ABP8HDA7_9BACT
MKKLITITGLLFSALLVLHACKHPLPEPPAGSGGGTGGTGGGTGGGPSAPPASCSPDTAYFVQQVLPILVSNCAFSGCHDVASARDGVVLTNYNTVMTTGGIRPGNPGGSDLYEMITETDPSERMPLGRTPLSASQIGTIRRWIQQGAKNNSCVNASCDSANVTFSGSVKPIIATKCQGCHSGAAPSGGINLSTHAGVLAKVSDGRLWGAINHSAGFQPMPRGGAKLSDCELTQFRKWIAAGAPNN